MKSLIFILMFVSAISACSKERNLPMSTDLDGIRANLEFACVHEASRLLPVNPDADILFRYGRYLQTRDGPKDFNEVARFYRIAASHGHYKANHNLQILISHGMANSPNAANEAVDWAGRLVDDGVPIGYYDVGYYLKTGYGLVKNKELALKFIRKAADLGNPAAQYYVSELLAPHDKAPAVSMVMLKCAADQGNARAAYELGIALRMDGKYQDAVVAYQKAVAAGSSVAGMVLQDAFLSPPESDELRFLNLPKDAERSKRYASIRAFLGSNELSNPKVPDIDQIVPLPPAKLPPWDGTFEWEKKRAEVPLKPSDDLIARLAKEKGLDPATGLPLLPDAKVSSNTGDARMPLGTTARTGERCPESGVWCALIRSDFVANKVQYFIKGDELPLLNFYKPRVFGILDRLAGERRRTGAFVWRLVAYERDMTRRRLLMS